jgi:hypothetical protein
MPSILTRPSGGSAGGGSLSIGVSSATPDYNGSLTITATATGITPTSYTFQISDAESGTATITQVSNALVWTVNKVGTVTISVIATDGSSEVGATEVVTVTDPINYATMLADYNAKVGITLVDGRVSDIADQSGNGYDIGTWTTNQRPFYESSTGKVIANSSYNCRMQTNAHNPLNGKSDITIFFKAAKHAPPSANQRLIGFGANGYQTIAIAISGDATRDVVIGENNYAAYIGFQADIINGNVVTFIKNGANPYVAYVDGSLAPIVTSGGTPAATLATSNGIHLFTQDGSFPLSGSFDRIIIYDTASLTSTQITAINERIKQLHP